MNYDYWTKTNISTFDGNEYNERYAFSFPFRASMIPNNTGADFQQIFNNNFMKCVDTLKKLHKDTPHLDHLNEILKVELRIYNNPSSENATVDMIIAQEQLIKEIMISNSDDAIDLLTNDDPDHPCNRLWAIRDSFDRFLNHTVIQSIYANALTEWNQTENGYMNDPKDIFGV